MPEGPEVWALSYALNKLKLNTQSYGKHLLYRGTDYSFGLTGSIHIEYTNDNDIDNDVNNNDKYKLTKVNKGLVYGKETQYNKYVEFAKIDWMTASDEQIYNIYMEWKKKPKKKAVSLLIDQSEMCGLGVAWISEIMNTAQLSIETKMENVNDVLVKSICETRDKVKKLYKDIIDNITKEEELIEFVNKWYYHNLYKMRTMHVYGNKMANKVKSGGRIFYTLL